MVAVAAYIQHATSDYIISESFNACGDPDGNLYGNKTWNGESEILITPPADATTKRKGPDILAADQLHDAITPFEKKTASKQSNCAKIQAKPNKPSPAGPPVSNRPAMGNELEDYIILALNPPEHHTVLKTLQHIIHEEKKNGLMFSHNHNYTSPTDDGNGVEMPYIYRPGAAETYVVKMGSPMLSEYMKNHYCSQCLKQAGQKIYFHVITDCGPSVAQKTRTVSNDLDSATDITPNRGKFFTGTPPQVEMGDDNLYAMEMQAGTAEKHRALAQHMMVRILYDSDICTALFPAHSLPPPPLLPNPVRGKLTNQAVYEMIVWVNSHSYVTNPAPNPDQKTFLLQDMYTNWLWQITLIHMFNVKYNVPNNNIADTTIETMQKGRAGEIEELKAHLNAFYRLTRFIFRMGVNGKLECKVIPSAPPAPQGLENCYINIVKKFYNDFWTHIPGINTSVGGWTANTSSANWLTRGYSQGWKKWAISQSGVATFMRNAFKHGTAPPGGVQDPPEHTFTQFVHEELSNKSIHRSGTSYPSIYNNTEKTKCRPNAKLNEDCNCTTSISKKTNLPINYCTNDESGLHTAGNPHPYGLGNYDGDNADAPKIPKQCYPHESQFQAAIATGTAADIYLEQSSQIITVQFLKTVGDQLHFADFMCKSKYLNHASIRPLLQITDRPLCAISLKYLAAKESYGILLMSGWAVFIDQYANHSGWKGLAPPAQNPNKNLKVVASGAAAHPTDCQVTPYAQISGQNVQVPGYKHFCIAWHKDADVNPLPAAAQQAAAFPTLRNWGMMAAAAGFGIAAAGMVAAHAASADGIMHCQVAVNFISLIRTVGGFGGGGMHGGGDFVKIDQSYYHNYDNYWRTSEPAQEECIKRIYEVQHISKTYMKFLNMWYIRDDDNVLKQKTNWFEQNFVYWVVCYCGSKFVDKLCSKGNISEVEDELVPYITDQQIQVWSQNEYNTWETNDECYRNEYIQEQIYIFIDMIDAVTFAIALTGQGRLKLIDICITIAKELYNDKIFSPIEIFLKEHQGDTAATAIQSAFRGHVARRRVAEDQSDSDADEDEDIDADEEEGDDDDGDEEEEEEDMNGGGRGLWDENNYPAMSWAHTWDGGGDIAAMATPPEDIAGMATSSEDQLKQEIEKIAPPSIRLLDWNTFLDSFGHGDWVDTSKDLNTNITDRILSLANKYEDSYQHVMLHLCPQVNKQFVDNVVELLKSHRNILPAELQRVASLQPVSGPFHLVRPSKVANPFAQMDPSSSPTKVKLGKRAASPLPPTLSKRVSSVILPRRGHVSAPRLDEEGEGMTDGNNSDDDEENPMLAGVERFSNQARARGGGGKLIKNKRSKKYKKTRRGKKSRRVKKSHKKKKVKCVKKSRKYVKKSRKGRNTRRKRHHSKKL